LNESGSTAPHQAVIFHRLGCTVLPNPCIRFRWAHSFELINQLFSSTFLSQQISVKHQHQQQKSSAEQDPNLDVLLAKYSKLVASKCIC
jgi:hypothetical protein